MSARELGDADVNLHCVGAVATDVAESLTARLRKARERLDAAAPEEARSAARARAEAIAELGAKEFPWLEGTLRQMRQRALEDAAVGADADFGATLTDLARRVGDAAYAHAALTVSQQ